MRINYDLGEVSILPEELGALEYFLRSDLWCEPDHIDKSLLDHAQIPEFLDLILG